MPRHDLKAARSVTDSKELQEQGAIREAYTSVTYNNTLHTPAAIQKACKQVAAYYYDHKGIFAYALFESVNAAFFGNELPWPLIQWGLTPHGRCLGYTHTGGPEPIITLHPSCLGTRSQDNPWSIPPGWLGGAFAADVLIHECMHVAVRYLRGGYTEGDSSHNNPVWIAEVNRLAPLLGFPEAIAGRSRPKREGNTVRRVTEGNVPFKAVATFPHSYRTFFGTATAYYGGDHMPVALTLPHDTAAWLASVNGRTEE